MIRFSDLNDDSSVTNLKYMNSSVYCEYNDSVFQKTYQIEIPCPSYRPSFYCALPVGIKDLARVKLEKLSDIFNIDSNGKYRLRDDEKIGMKFGAFLAVGLPSKDYKYLATIDTKFRAVYCAGVVESESVITVTEVYPMIRTVS